MKRKVFWRKTKFEKFLFEVFPDETVDDKVDGGVEHERQLVDRGDRQPQLPGERILGAHNLCMFFYFQIHETCHQSPCSRRTCRLSLECTIG